MTVRVKDLKNQTGVTEPHPVLYCCVCGETYSANKGDYFDLSEDYVFKCCDEECRLVRKRTTYEDV